MSCILSAYAQWRGVRPFAIIDARYERTIQPSKWTSSKFRGRSRGVRWVRTSPLRDQEIFWSNSRREGAEFGEMNCVGWYEKEKGGWGSSLVDTGLEELRLKRICASRVWRLKRSSDLGGQNNPLRVWRLKKVTRFLVKKTNPIRTILYPPLVSK